MVEVVEEQVLVNPSPGNCYYYHEGAAEILLCTKSAAEGKGANLINGFLYNNGMYYYYYYHYSYHDVLLLLLLSHHISMTTTSSPFCSLHRYHSAV